MNSHRRSEQLFELITGNKIGVNDVIVSQPTYTKDEVRKEKVELLNRIINPNYDKELGTYDYDGIAESALKELTKLLEEL